VPALAPAWTSNACCAPCVTACIQFAGSAVTGAVGRCSLQVHCTLQQYVARCSSLRLDKPKQLTFWAGRQCACWRIVNGILAQVLPHLYVCVCLRSLLQYCVTIHWPTSWLATRGYTSFTLGFETRQEAVQWHTHVQKHVSSMRLRSSSVASKADPSASACHSSKPSYDDRTMQWSSGGTTITRKPSQVRGHLEQQQWTCTGVALLLHHARCCLRKIRLAAVLGPCERRCCSDSTSSACEQACEQRSVQLVTALLAS
jgi:hypothetical protein